MEPQKLGFVSDDFPFQLGDLRFPKLTCPLKRDYFNRKHIDSNHWFSGFQPLIFQGFSQLFGESEVTFPAGFFVTLEKGGGEK